MKKKVYIFRSMVKLFIFYAMTILMNTDFSPFNYKKYFQK